MKKLLYFLLFPALCFAQKNTITLDALGLLDTPGVYLASEHAITDQFYAGPYYSCQLASPSNNTFYSFGGYVNYNIYEKGKWSIRLAVSLGMSFFELGSSKAVAAVYQKFAPKLVAALNDGNQLNSLRSQYERELALAEKRNDYRKKAFVELFATVRYRLTNLLSLTAKLGTEDALALGLSIHF